jgi:endonuclease/exonuclease/phosphatase family metal-dependent hydrolase
MRFLRSVVIVCSLLAVAQIRAETIRLATLNTYWFFNGAEGDARADKPRTTIEYSTKAGHLIGLLPAEPPLFVGFQELGGGEDLAALAHSASARFGRSYQPLFVRGNDTATGQNVGAILDTSRGWGVYGRASRVSDLEHEVSKHLVVRLTNAATSIDICLVHLRRPLGADGTEKQKDQCRALLRWAMRHLANNPKANLVVMGDFNESQPVGSNGQALSVLFGARPPLKDTLSLLGVGKISTHIDGNAYDRILVSDAIAKGLDGLKVDGVIIQKHRHGKGEERRLYTDHFPVVVTLALVWSP